MNHAVAWKVGAGKVEVDLQLLLSLVKSEGVRKHEAVRKHGEPFFVLDGVLGEFKTGFGGKELSFSNMNRTPFDGFN